MPDSLTPITREETYLAAIAGEDVTAPDPICRKEEFLDAIDTHIGSVESDVSNVSGAVTALQTQIPASTAGDEGKVLTAGSTAGTASWQTASGGGGVLLVKATGTVIYVPGSGYLVPADKTVAELEAAFGATGTTPVYILFPSFSGGSEAPAYSYSTASQNIGAFLYSASDGTVWRDSASGAEAGIYIDNGDLYLYYNDGEQ